LQYWGKIGEFDKFLRTYGLKNKVILSAYDLLYLDCGQGNIYGDNSWCLYNNIDRMG